MALAFVSALNYDYAQNNRRTGFAQPARNGERRGVADNGVDEGERGRRGVVELPARVEVFGSAPTAAMLCGEPRSVLQRRTRAVAVLGGSWLLMPVVFSSLRMRSGC
jgi:hypothetical protein